jgi:hypothetical protein
MTRPLTNRPRPDWVHEIHYENVDELIVDLAAENQERRPILRLLVTGSSGSGKTRFVNDFLIGFETSKVGQSALSETRDVIVTRLNLVDGIYEVIDMPGLGDNRSPRADAITLDVLKKLFRVGIDFTIFLTSEHRLEFETMYKYQCAIPGFFNHNIIILRTFTQPYINALARERHLMIRSEPDLRHVLKLEQTWADSVGVLNQEYPECPLPLTLPPLILAELSDTFLRAATQPYELAMYPWWDEFIAMLQNSLPPGKAHLLDWIIYRTPPPLARTGPEEAPANILVAEIPFW